MFSTKGDALIDWPLSSPMPSGQALFEWQIRTDKPEIKRGESFDVTLDIHLRYQYEETEERLHQTSPEILTVTLDTSAFIGEPISFPGVSSAEFEGLGPDGILPLQGDTTISRTVHVPVSDSLSPGTYVISAELKGSVSNPLQITVIGDQVTPPPTPQLSPPEPEGSNLTLSTKNQDAGNPSITLWMRGPYSTQDRPEFSIQKGQSITQSYQVTNTGSIPTSPITLEFSLESETIITLGSISIPSLAPGESNTGDVTHTIPLTALNGSYMPWLIAKTGNVTLTQIYIPRSVIIYDTPERKPDLIPMTLQIPQIVTSGSTIFVPCSVKNNGSANDRATDFNIFLSPDKQYSNSSIIIGTGQLEALDAGIIGQVTISATIPQSAMNEYYYAGLMIDSSQKVTEYDETNNILIYDTPLTITGAPGPDLMGSITIASVKPDGKTLLVGYRIFNAGKGAANGTKLKLVLTDQNGNEATQLAVIDLPSITAGQSYEPSQVQYKPVVETGDYTVRGTILLPPDINQVSNTFYLQKTVHLTGTIPLTDNQIRLNTNLTSEKTGDINLTGNARPPVASFNMVPLSGQAPLMVTFTDTSTGNPKSRQWEFGDGQTSTDQSPDHTYTIDGTYQVTLTVTGQSGEQDSVTRTIKVTGEPELKADFSYAPKEGGDPLNIIFTEHSTGNPQSFQWNFGDGGHSSDRNPEQTFTKPGIYMVSLTITNPGSDTVTKAITVGSGDQSSSKSETFGSVSKNNQITHLE
ncbi:MAG TPA: PKD domain-containing protein [Methanospirillum sp.]|nr:PKD domain-containing protein [Methanospirillum sp.]